MPYSYMKLMFFASLLAVSPAATAQEAPPPEKWEGPAENGQQPAGPPAGVKPVFDENWATVGIGVGVSASYDGSDSYNAFPAPIIRGSYDGFDFGANGPGLYVDLVRDNKSESKTKFIFGPQFRVRLDRVNDIDDPVVELLGEEDAAVELGFTAGVKFDALLNPFDSLQIGVDAGWDIAGGHSGRVISPSIAYSTPLSRAAFARIGISANIVDDDYADTYFSIDSAGNLASGLPVFTADGGVKDIGGNLLLGYDLSGNALDGGFSVFAIGNYSQLLNDAKRSPVTSIRGDAGQWFGAVGVAYTF